MAAKKTAKKPEKFEVKCLKNFRDKHTGKIHAKGDVFKVTEERFNEIRNVGELVEKHIAPAKETAAVAE